MYLGMTALIRLPSFPITPLKLAVLAFAFSEGSIGRVMDRIVPKLAGRRTAPRMPKATLETTLSAVTVLWEMTSVPWDAWTQAELMRDRDQWESWKAEILLDAAGKANFDQPRPVRTETPGPIETKAVSAPAPVAVGAAGQAKARLIPPVVASSTVSDEGPSPHATCPSSPPSSKPKPQAVASLTATGGSKKRARGGAGKSPQPPSATMSKAGSRASTPGTTGSTTPGPGHHKKAAKRRRLIKRPTPPPEMVPVLPPHRFPPPLPPVVPKAGLIRKSPTQVEEEARSVALHRPRRGVGHGALEMVPIDLEGWWRVEEEKERVRLEDEKAEKEKAEKEKAAKEEHGGKARMVGVDVQAVGAAAVASELEPTPMPKDEEERTKPEAGVQVEEEKAEAQKVVEEVEKAEVENQDPEQQKQPDGKPVVEVVEVEAEAVAVAVAEAAVVVAVAVGQDLDQAEPRRHDVPEVAAAA